MPIILEEITSDDDNAMECAGYVRIATFKDRGAFEASGFETDVNGPLRATEVNEQDGFDNFTIWADHPDHRQ
jgi:hypothetical protein